MPNGPAPNWSTATMRSPSSGGFTPGSVPSPSVAWLRLGTSAVRRNVITRTPFWFTTRVSTLTIPRSPCFDSRSASTVDSE